MGGVVVGKERLRGVGEIAASLRLPVSRARDCVEDDEVGGRSASVVVVVVNRVKCPAPGR